MKIWPLFHAGIAVNRTLLGVALVSGGFAGLAGVSEVAGLKGYLTADISPGFGYTGIVVAMLAGLSPLGVVIAALFIAAVFVGADNVGAPWGFVLYCQSCGCPRFALFLIGGLSFRLSIPRVWGIRNG